MMNDLISRVALLNDLFYCAPELWQDEEYVKAKIMKQPAVDAAPVVHSHWVYKERHRSSYRLVNGYDAMGEMHSIMVHEESDGKEPYCARCGAAAAESFMDYCPRCGARMDMEEED